MKDPGQLRVGNYPWVEPSAGIWEKGQDLVERVAKEKEHGLHMSHANPGKYLKIVCSLAVGNTKKAIAERYCNGDRHAVYRVEREVRTMLGELKERAAMEWAVLTEMGRDKLTEALTKFELPEEVTTKDLTNLALCMEKIDVVFQRHLPTLDKGAGDTGKKFTAEDVASLHEEMRKKMEKDTVKKAEAIDL